MNLYSILADAVVAAHLAYVLFVLLGLVAILVGYVRKWGWVRNVWFRAIHFAMIAIVVVEALLSITCPLTTWETALRAKAGEQAASGSFVGRLAHELLFMDFSPQFFTVAYCVFGGLVLATFVLVPPRLRKGKAAETS